MADGCLNFDTTIDTSGFSQASSKITKEAEKVAENVSAEANETSQKIQAILDDSTRSMKSKAMSIAAIYRGQGLAQSEAMQMAWSHIERGSAEANDDILNDTKKTHKKIRSEFNKTSGEAVGSFKSTLSGVKSILGKMVAAVGVAFSVGALVNFGKQAITIASDVQEVQNVVDTAFGEMSYKMEEFADTAIESFGISKLSAKQTGSTLMAMAKGMGIAEDSASDMAIALTGLSADMASFYNVSQDVASTALKSIFTGETETLKQFGVVMTEANLEAFALSQGITKSVSAMNQAEKVQLRYAYVMQQTALAQGDFAKTSGSWANQTRILSEQWKEFSSIVGSVLINVLTPAVRTLNSILSQLIESTRNAAELLGDIFGFDLSQSFSTGSLAADTAAAADNYADIADSSEEAAEASERQLMGFDEINKLSGDSGSSESNVGELVTNSIEFDATPAADSAEEAADEVSGIFSVFQNAWNNAGDDLISSVQTAFAKIKSLVQSAYGSIERVWNNGSGEKYVTDIIQLFGDVFGIIGDISDALKTAWDDGGRGDALVQSYIDKWSAFLELLHEVSAAFREVWNDGTGEQICGSILEIITNINNTTTNLRERFTEAWSGGENGQRIAEGILGIIESIFETVNNITGAAADWAETLDFTPLLESVTGLLESIEPLTENIGAGLEWFYTNVLLPITSWTIEDAIPAFLDLLSGAIDVLNASVDALKPLGEWLWAEFLEPIADWTGGAIADILEDVGDGLRTISDLISGKLSFDDIIKDLGALEIVFGSVAAAIGLVIGAQAIGGLIVQLPLLLAQIIAQTTALIANAAAWVAANLPILAVVAAIAAVIAIGVLLYQHWEEIKEFAIETWESIQEALYTFFDWCVEKFNELVEFFSSIWQSIKEVFATVGEWFIGIFQAAWDGIVSAWNAVTDWFSGLWGDIKNVFSSVGSWFSGKFTVAWNNIKTAFSKVGTFFGGIWDSIKKPFLYVTDWFKEKFSSAWQAVKDVFSAGGKIFEGIKDGIGNVFTDVVNVLIDGINTVIAAPFNAINDAISWIRELDIAGWEPFSGLSEINIPEIPHLAQGTVVPANFGEFAAILGDNKREPEIVSPYSTMVQAFRDALSEMSAGRSETIKLVLDGKTVSEVVRKYNARTSKAANGGAL